MKTAHYPDEARSALIRHLLAFHERSKIEVRESTPSVGRFTLIASPRLQDIAHAFYCGWKTHYPEMK